MASAPARVPPAHGPGEFRHICTTNCPRQKWQAAIDREAVLRHETQQTAPPRPDLSPTSQEATVAATTSTPKAKPKAKPTAERALPPRGTGTAQTIAREDIVIRKEFNPRSSMEKAALDELAASIKARGVLQALTVRKDTKTGKFLLLGGHRRVAAGDTAGVKTYNAVVRDSDERDELVDAFVDNRLREDLTPLEEARTFHRLKEGGLTVKGIADACTVSEKLVHDRLAILELPKEIQEHYGTGALPTGSVRPLVAMTKLDPRIAVSVVKTALSDNRTHGISPTSIAQSAEQHAVAAAEKIKGLYVIDWQGRVDAMQLPWDKYQGGDTLTAKDDMPRLLKALGAETAGYYQYRPKLTKADMDTLRAAGVLYGATSRGDGDAVVKDAQSLMALCERIIRRDHAADLKRQSEQRAATRKGGDAAAKADETAKAYKETVDARAKNLALGDALLSNLASVTLTMDVAKTLCLTILEGNIYGSGNDRVSDLAMAGLRYVLPSWQEEKQQKNGKVKVTYKTTKSGGYKELAKLFWEWWNLASTPGEVVGRTLIAMAAATYADQKAVAKSSRGYYHPSGTGSAEALKRVVDPHLPKPAPAAKKPAAKAALDDMKAADEDLAAGRTRSAADVFDVPEEGAAPAAPEPVIVQVRSPAGVNQPLQAAELQTDTQPGRPNVVKVIYCDSRTSAWIDKTRIVDTTQQTTVDEHAAESEESPKTVKAIRDRALEMITKRPGIAIPELAEALGINQNGLYRHLPAMAKERLIVKSGRGWHAFSSPGTEADSAKAAAPVEVTELQGRILKALHAGLTPAKGEDHQAAIRKAIGIGNGQSGAVGNSIKSLLAKGLLDGGAGAPYITKRGSEIAETLQ